MTQPGVTIDVTTSDDGGAVEHLVAPLQARLEVAARSLELADCALTVVLTGDDTLQRLNHEYRGLDRPTDVLSFAADPGATEPDQPRYLGDVLISMERAAAQAGEGPDALEDELALLGFHGLLHLLGHDDETDEGRALMEDIERKAGVR